MATLTPQSGHLSLLELANRTNDGSVMSVAEVLNETNDFLREAVFLEANGATGHTFTQRTSLPSGSFRRLNDGVATESSTTKQVTESIGMLEAFSQVDEALVGMSGDPKQFRMLEDMAFIEGLGQTFASTFIYGDTEQNPERFKGLAPRVTSASATNAINGGGSGDDLSSIWIVAWGPRGVYFTYPKGSRAGLVVEDLGPQRVAGATGTFMAYMTHFVLRVGLVVGDDRAVRRICNIETSGTTNTFDEDDLIGALNAMPSVGRKVIYMNSTLKTQVDIAAKDASNVNYQPGEFGGQEVTMFKGVPIRIVDAISNTESALI